MSAKRYFQLSFLWPVVLPSIMLASSGPVVPEWIGQICRWTLRAGGIPYLLFAVAVIVWSQKKDAASVRRATYLGPVLFLPVLFVYLTLATLFSAAQYSSDQIEMIALFLIYGLFAAIVVLTVGYAYVGFINLGFVILRSWGAFNEDPSTAEEILRNWEPRASQEQAPPQTPTSGQVASRPVKHWTPSPAQACTPYGFVSWDDAKLKGSATAHSTARKSARKARTASPRTWWDPVLTASLVLLAPLIILSAFALCRHYGVLRGQTGANYPAGASAGHKAAVSKGGLEHR